MEDALARNTKQATSGLLRLNPCFNGRCTRTTLKGYRTKFGKSLNPCFNGRCTRTNAVIVLKGGRMIVLILVLMEDALALRLQVRRNIYCVLILVLMEDALAQVEKNVIAQVVDVLILVLMEDALAQQN